MNQYVGIDEAGRGAVVGPLVMAALLFDRSTDFSSVVLRDSKDMSSKQRSETLEHLREHSTIAVACIPAFVIARNAGKLNRLEAELAANLLKSMPGVPAIIDEIGGDAGVQQNVRNEYPDRQIHFEPGADESYPGVSAASVAAKVARDRALALIEQQYDTTIGSGYPADPETQDWLADYNRTHEGWPPVVRTNWSTIQRMED